MAGLGFIRPVHPIAIDLARPDLREVHMPDLIGPLFHPNSLGFFLMSSMVEKAKLNPGRIFRKQGEVHSLAIPCGPLGIWAPWPPIHSRHSLFMSTTLVLPALKRCVP